MIVLASCQDVAEETGQIEPVSFEPGYPSLHTVPPRPQLSYTIEQRRAIVDGLIADRANARYSSDVVRYRAGLSSLPPPAPPAMAAVPLEPQPEVPDAADAIAPQGPARDAPVVDPETELLYEDDDLGTFMEEMVDERIGPPGPTDGGPRGEPEAHATPLGTGVLRASADRPILRAAAYSGRPPVVTLAMPPKTASLPVPVAPNGREHPAASVPAAVERALAGRAPGVVWGMPDLTLPPAEPTRPLTRERGHAPPPPTAPVETRLAGRAPGVVWGMPDPAPPPAQPVVAMAETAPDRISNAASPAPVPVEPSLAARAPGVVWGMPDLAAAPAEYSAAIASTQVAEAAMAPSAAPRPAPVKPAPPAQMLLAEQQAAPLPPTRPPRQVAAPAPAPAKPVPPGPAEIVLAGPAPAPVRATWTAVAERPPEASAEAGARSVYATTAPHPGPGKPTADAGVPALEPITPAVAGRLVPQPDGAAGIELARGLLGIEGVSSRPRGAALGAIPFRPDSAMLTPDATARLGQLVAETETHAVRIKVVGEAPAPALALDRALAVGLALVQSGVPADQLELTLALGGAGDQARLFLAAPTL